MASDPAAVVELRIFLRKSAARKFDWVSCNCGFWVCEWIKLRTGSDPVESYREQFKTRSGFQRHIMRAGGNEAFSRKIADEARLKGTEEPNLGDVGLIATGDGATMAIKADRDNWALKTLHGVAVGPFEQIIAWRL